VLSYSDPPRGRHPTFALPPFQSRRISGAELCGSAVDYPPSESVVGHTQGIGQSVQLCKDKLPDDIPIAPRHGVPMAETTASSEYNKGLLARTRELRERKNWTAEEMALALGVPAERYRKYETRTPIPHELIERLALVADSTVHYIITGTEPFGRHGANLRAMKAAEKASMVRDKRA